MSIDHDLYLDTAASRHELREVLLQAGLGLVAQPEDWTAPGSGALASGAFNQATLVSILDDLLPIFRRPRAGVVPTRLIGFRYRKKDMDRFDRDAAVSIAALLRAYPQADALWEGLGGVPVLLRRHGRLVVSEAAMAARVVSDSDGALYPEWADLSYVVEPLGPWP